MSTFSFNTNKEKITTILRLFLSLMFLFSAFSKLYPSPNLGLGSFEGTQLIPMGFSPWLAAWFSRTIIGAEFALGFMLLMPYYFRKLVIPGSMALLVVFTVHLTYQLITDGNQENCGCFGTLMPFSTRESIVKNIIFLGLFGWLWQASKGMEDRKSFWPLATVKFGAIMLVFMLGLKVNTPATSSEVVVVEKDESAQVDNTTTVDTTKNITAPKIAATDSVKKPEVKDEPKQTKSGFAGQYADIDKGRKILCFFAAGCDHCRETVRLLTEMKKQVKDFPEMKIIFMDEETELIPEFFEQAGAKYTYKILDPASFYTVMGPKNDTPAVFYIWNGKVIKNYSGTDAQKFNAPEFKKIIQKKYSELK